MDLKDLKDNMADLKQFKKQSRVFGGRQDNN